MQAQRDSSLWHARGGFSWAQSETLDFLHAADMYLSPAEIKFSNPGACKTATEKIYLSVHVVSSAWRFPAWRRRRNPAMLSRDSRFFRSLDYKDGGGESKVAISMLCVGFTGTAAPFKFA